ncbi:probable beta-1,4-xylosyltransferase GT43A [Typha latifolia]|uniref:probable beta-1,4-xylosyltransferase GT43A n=1 Tax=Typha latifolia TaxID=4733 RepID=UPI003C2D4590
MSSFDRSKQKKSHLWKKALLHFSLCFVMGFSSGFFPKFPSSSSSSSSSPRPHKFAIVTKAHLSIPPTNITHSPPVIPEVFPADDDAADSNPRRNLILITTTRSGDPKQPASLMRLAHTLRLVPPPLLWLVVEAHDEAPGTAAAVLRGTGVMYRHLTFTENFTDYREEVHHQRNVALSHVEHHRLSGIVHFAAAANVYDLQFFQEIREIETFGAWPVATVSAGRKKVVVEGPICSSSKVSGWFLKDVSGGSKRPPTSLAQTNVNKNVGAKGSKPSKINISGFAFNSSVLWDPERWGRSTSLPDTSQDSIKFVQEVVLEDDSKLKGIPSDCSQIMLWHLHIPRATPPPLIQNQTRS